MVSVKISARLPVDLYQRLEDPMTTNKLSQMDAIISASIYSSHRYMGKIGHLVNTQETILYFNGLS